MANTQNDSFTKDGAMPELKNKIQYVENQLEKISHESGQKAGEMASKIADSAQDYVKSSREYVVENPVKGVAIAALAGIVAGSLLTMAVRSSSSSRRNSLN